VSTPDVETSAVAAATTAFAAPQDPSADSGHSVNRHQDQGSAAAVAATTSKSTDRPSGQSPAVAAALNTGPADQGSSQVSGQSTVASDAGTSQVDRVRFLQRVAGAFRAADEQGGQIRLRLSPPELGSMKLELNVRDGLMTAHVQAETDAARNLLLDHLPQLRERLADHNIKIDHFDVELMNQSKSGTPQNFAGGRDASSPFVQQSSRRTPNVAAAAVSAASALPRAEDFCENSGVAEFGVRILTNSATSNRTIKERRYVNIPCDERRHRRQRPRD
jgi:flagellar hook-length control protein FliK